MDLNLFSTQIVASGQKATKTALSGNNAFATQGLAIGGDAFWNIILGGVTAEEAEVKADNENKKENATDVALKGEKVDLALLQLALMGQDADQTLDQKLSDLQIERLVQTQENRVDQLTKLIKHLASGLPENSIADGTIEDLVSRLEKRLEKLEASLESFRTGDFGDEGAPFQLLIATGMDPNQLTKITNRIEEVENKLGRKLTVEDLIAGVGNIIPAPGKQDEQELSTSQYLDLLMNQEQVSLTLNNKGVSKGENKDGSEQNGAPDIEIEPLTQEEFAALSVQIEFILKNSPNKRQDITSLLNQVANAKIAAAGTPSQGLTPANGETENLGVLPTTGDTDDAVDGSIVPLGQRIDNAQFKALFGNINIAQQAGAGKSSPPTTDALQQVKLPIANIAGTFTLPTDWNASTSLNNVLSETLGFDIQTGTPFNSVMQAAQASTSIPQAGQTHPGTQTVAAQITKAANGGETGKMVLQLDPPELGRVEVRLEFGKDKSVKAHLIVEKPETYLMLQRDAAALERALQNAGLDTDSGSLNYQMADQNYGFNTGKDGQGSGQNNGGNGAEDSEAEIIETTMTWNVDQETGHVRYNLLA